MSRRRRRPRWWENPVVLAAIVTAVGGIVTVIFTGGFGYLKDRLPDARPTPTPVTRGARLEGMVVDRSGKPLGDLSVSLRNGPTDSVDTGGHFVIDNAPVGDQHVIVKSPGGQGGDITQIVRLEEGKTTKTSIVYDTDTSRIGLLSINVPLDDSKLDVLLVGNRRMVRVYGRCDGLTQILGNNFKIWVLVKPFGDRWYYVQDPATVDPSANSWQADIYVGDEAKSAENGSLWTLVALAGKPGTRLDKMSAISNPSDVPERISSNVVNFTAIINAQAKATAAFQRLRVTGDHRRDVYETPNGSIAGKVEPGSVLKVIDTVQLGAVPWYQVKLEQGHMYTLARPVNTLMTGRVSQLAVTPIE